MISSLTCLRCESPLSPTFPSKRVGEERAGRPRSQTTSLAQATEHLKEPTMRLLFVSSALMLLALTPAIAQSMQKPRSAPPAISNQGAPGTKERAPGMPAPHQANLPDQVFVIRAIRGGAGGIQLARLAEQKTRSDPVRQLARQVIKDHSQANDALGRLAGEDGAPAPEPLDAEHPAVRDGLGSLACAEFDIGYLRTPVANPQR